MQHWTNNRKCLLLYCKTSMRILNIWDTLFTMLLYQICKHAQFSIPHQYIQLSILIPKNSLQSSWLSSRLSSRDYSEAMLWNSGVSFLGTKPYYAEWQNPPFGKALNGCTAGPPFCTLHLLYDVHASSLWPTWVFLKETNVFQSSDGKEHRSSKQKWFFYLPRILK